MNNLSKLLSGAVLATSAFAQNVAVYPNEYVNVPEGPTFSSQLPLAKGISRVMCLYEDVDLDVPHGTNITKLGFRQDGDVTTFVAGRSLQLEVRMGWTTEDHVSMQTNFDNNYATTPSNVFGPALYTLPNLHDPANPLPNGQFFITLQTPFLYQPNGRNLLVEYRIFGTSAGGAQFNYRLDRADFYSPRTYGPAGCMHTSGQISNLTLAETRPGINFTANATSAPSNSPAFLAVNVGNPIVPPYDLSALLGIGPNCTGQMNGIGMTILSGGTTGSGNAVWTFLIPNNNIFGDVTISAQGLFLDFFVPGGLVTSRAGHVVTGIRNRSAIVAASGAPTSVTTGQKSGWYCPVAFFEYQ
tara:strand:- start:26272 stop:27339 length:1068 start_codon:yes stop_codon:yes gene_type:complete